MLIGSINFDPRSFALNAECGVIVADSALARQMEAVFAIDLAHSRRIDITTLDAMTPFTRAADAMCYWARAQL
jgi:phosphatidylserine/phosphatidylglycerophosphate/cardiolipin synthase-like enzyme